MRRRCRREIEELHHFFEQWFTAGVEGSRSCFERLDGVLAADFELISPDGRLTSRRGLVDSLRAAHGSQPPGAFRIWTAAHQGRRVGDGTWLVTYQEWQVHAGHAPRGRLSTALFRPRDDTPNGVEWVHLHEVWLPPGIPAPPPVAEGQPGLL